jgi:hypothetical protein
VSAPTAALACSGGPSAVNVYKECFQTGGGGKATGGGNSSGGPSTGSTASAPVSSQTQKALSKAPAQDRRVLSALVRHTSPSRLGMDRTGPTSAATAPSAIGSAFDLGSGPTALLVALAATAFLLLGATAFRGARQRRR